MDHLISELGDSATNLGRQAMHRVRSNILPRVEREFRDNIVPKLEQKGKELKKRWEEEYSQQQQKGGVKRRRRPRPPSNTDIVYLTDRFLVSSKPALDFSTSSGPTFLDIGRDITAREAAVKAEIRQIKQRHDRTYQHKGNRPLSRLGTTTDAIHEHSEHAEEEEDECQDPSSNSIPEEEGHDPPDDVDSNSDGVGKQEEAAKISENPQEAGSISSLPTEETTAPTGSVETAIGDGGVVVIDDQEGDSLSPSAKPPLPPPSTNSSNHSLKADASNHSPEKDVSINGDAIRTDPKINNEDSPTRSIDPSFHRSSHSCDTELIVNHEVAGTRSVDGSFHRSTYSCDTELAENYEAPTPLTKNIPVQMLEVDGEITEEGEGPPLIPTMPVLPTSSPSKPPYEKSESNPLSDDGESSFATCMTHDDNDTFDSTPDQQQQSRPEPAIKPPQQESQPEPAKNEPQDSSVSTPVPTAASIINSPGTMVTYLDNVHGRDNYLAISLAKQKPDDRTMLLFRRQIVPMGLSDGSSGSNSSKWSPCCVERSETPSIPHVLKICYALHAFLHLDPNNVVLTYCDNGKTRTAIIAACYLRFTNMVERTEDGFRYFLSTLRRQRKLLLEREKERRKAMGPFLTATMDAMMGDYIDDEDYHGEVSNENIGEERSKNDTIVENIIKQIPPSLKLFFKQFDRVLQLGGFLNQKPLLLRAVMLQGVPVEVQPCLDIWDSSQRHVYSSHPPVSTSIPRNKNTRPTSQWVDEEGVYRTNIVLDGEFLVLCRFGGDADQLAKERHIHDPTKILFRYTNTTGFMSGGCPYELPSKQVDLTRMYADHLDDEDFLLTLLFEADWEHIEDDEYNIDNSVSLASRKKLKATSETCGQRIWRSHEEAARDEGWRVIFENHFARPTAIDVESFRRVYGHPSISDTPDMSQCPDHLVTLALQLTNYDYQRSAALLLNSPVFSWWREDDELSLSPLQPTPTEVMNGINGAKRDRPIEIETNLNIDGSTKKSYKEIETEATQSVLDILDSVDVTSNLDPSYQSDFNRWRSVLTHDSSSLNGNNGKDQSTSLIDNNRLNKDHQNSLSRLCLKETGYLVPSIIYPQRGDITRSFQIHGTASSPERRNNADSQLRSLGFRKPPVSKLRIPYYTNDKPKLLPPPSDHIKIPDYVLDITKQEYPIPVYDPKREAAKEIFSQLHHTGVTLDMLLEVQQASQQWTEYHESEVPINPPDGDAIQNVVNEETTNKGEQRESTMNREEKGRKEKEWQEAQRVEAEEKRKTREQEKAAKSEEAEGEKEIPLKDDPEYGKYFKMLKLGMPREQVLHALKRDEKDPGIIDLDPNKSLESQLPSAGDDGEDEVPLKDDPEYAKYFKMLKLGMPKEQVLHAFQRDGKDPKILDLDPDKSLESQLPSANEDDEFPLEDDPEYVKYFKMLKLGMPKEQVLHALKRDEKNPKILDFDPKKSLKSQLEQPTENGDGTPLKDDPEYSKYFKMMKMGMPKEQVLHAIKRDGKDPKVLDLDPNKSLKSQEQSDDGPPLKDDPEYAKYFKMAKVGLEKDAIKNALVRDGKDPSIMDLDPNKSLKAQKGGGVEEKDTGTPLKDDPEYAKYFKMEKMGLPKDAVRNALVRDGKNPEIIDFDPNMSLDFQLKKSKSASSTEKPAKKKKKKKKIRRKKIYWNPIDPKKLKEDSLWNMVRDRIAMGNLEYDLKEFEELFTESAEAGAQQKKKGPAPKEAKKAVQAIDPKRSMNGGIVLSRIKTDREKVAEFVNKMDHTKFDEVELKNLKEYLATDDERRALTAYMSKGGDSEEKKKELFTDLSETEKYMVTLMKVSDAEAKLHTMEFRNGFKNRFADMTSALKILSAACDELRSSEKFRKLMAMILTVVNQINTGGEGTLAMGFTLDALLKLNEAKAFDKKTSVLHYVVKLVKKNDDSLLYFEKDLGHVIPAESVLLDTITADVKILQDELTEVIKIVTKDADSLEKSGQLAEPTLAELVEQKSIVQDLGGAPKSDTATQSTGRTPMERFSMNAKVACEQAIESINSVQTKYVMVLSYFGEDEKMPTGDFFGILRRFMTEWKKATLQVEKIERRKAKEKKREAKRAAKAKKKAKALKSSSRKKGDGSKSSDANDATTTIQPSPGGIAALAAQAAEEISNKQDADKPPPKQPNGGIAALAAQAALKKSHKKEEKEEPDSVPPVGGIAALAAQAALKKSQKEASNSAPPVGGIAALAAQAALKKSQKEASNSAPPVGGIAALAAQAALKKSQKEASNSAPPVGGIAALAAQAALKKSQKEESNSPLPVGGIAALAAQAALKKSQKEESNSPSPVVGIAALAAQAALKKSQNKEVEHPVGGIAALAAQAALKKSQNKEVEHPVGGIATLAAQAALKKSQSKEIEPPVGGIAALAAQAALKKSQKEDVKQAVGGIAELAVEDALKKSKQEASEEIHLETPAAVNPEKQAEKAEQSSPEPPAGGIAAVAAQVGLEKSEVQAATTEESRSEPRDGESTGISADTSLEKSEKDGVKEAPSEVSALSSSLAAQVAVEATPRRSSLAAQVELEKEKNQSPKGETPHSPKRRMSSLAAQVALEKTPKQSPQDMRNQRPSKGGKSSLASQVELEHSPKKSPQDTRTQRRKSSLAAQVELESSPNKTPQDTRNQRRKSSLAAQVELEKTPKTPKTPKQSPKDNSSQRSNKSGMSSLAAQVALEKTPPEKNDMSSLALPSLATQRASEKAKTPSPQNKTPPRSPTKSPRSPIKSSLSLALENALTLSPHKKSPHRSPTGLMSSLANALEKARQQDTSAKRKSPSLGAFFEKQNRQDERVEILRQNHDDSSVAKMAFNLQRESMDGNNAWNQGGGISDYMGWANQAIKISDTESVRDFETARDMVFDDGSTIATGMDDSTHATGMDDSTYASNFDDGTIATNFDDDASIASEMPTPRNENEYSKDDYYSSEQYSNYPTGAHDPYSYSMATDGTQNPYGGNVIDMPIEFNQDMGMDPGLSFGGDEGFDGPGEYGNDIAGGAYGGGLGGYGQDAGLGGFGMTSPLAHAPQNDFSTPGTSTFDRPWGATPNKVAAAASNNDGNPNRPWGATPNKTTNATPAATTTSKTEEDGVVFRGWGAAPKEPEPPKRNKWFWQNS